MRLTKVDDRIKFIVNMNSAGKIDFYILTANNKKIYAFTRIYSARIWELCRSGVMVNRLMYKRTKNEDIMLLVKYVRYIMPYLCEEYNIGAA